MKRPFRFQLFRSLWFDRRINAAVFLGVLCTAAVLTGALLVGDSMRGSLRALTLDRLGRIDVILQGSSFFHGENESFRTNHWAQSIPAILLPAAVEKDGKIGGVQLLGFDPEANDEFADCVKNLRRDEIVVNRALADRLNLREGETVSLRLNSLQPIPPESSFGHRDDLIVRIRMKVGKIIPHQGIGRFSLKADQQAEALVIASNSDLRRRLEIAPKQFNTVFFLSESPEIFTTPERLNEIRSRFHPLPEDIGIEMDEDSEPDGRIYVKTKRMLFTRPQAEEIQKTLPMSRPGLLYLATSIKALKNGKETPYSTVYACDIPSFETEEKPNAASDDDSANSFPIVLNRWTADDLDVEIGDEIELTWFDPEDVDKTFSRKFRLAEILPMRGVGADARLVPEVKGLTDEKTIADWDPPFPFDAKKIRQKDEDYWDVYRAAPKAFVPLEVGRRLWGSRFGETTTFVLDGKANISGESFADGLNSAVFGLDFIPVKARGLAASSGTTPFSVLFLSFSFFIIASALMLVLMLFRLSVEMKARQIGIRLAVGWTPRRIARGMLAEGTVIALAGSLFGIAFGILYARLMVYGLTTWWVDAVSTPFLTLYVNPWSLLIGFSCSVVLALLTILATLRGIGRIPVVSLLAGILETPAIKVERFWSRVWNGYRVRRPEVWKRWEWAVFIAILLMLASLFDNQAASFFMMGAVLLALGLWQIRAGYFEWITNRQAIRTTFDFAQSNAARNRGRSLLCIGLVASTTFLVLSIGAFRLDPSVHSGNQSGRFGWKGYTFLGETAFPVYHDIATPEGRMELGIQDADNEHLQARMVDVLSFRMRDGDNASCLNLYQPDRPRILGVPRNAVSDEKSFWNVLNRPVSQDPDGVRRVPVMLDSNTAMYSLHLSGKTGEVYELDDEQGGKIRCEVVGLLSNSVVQGDILMNEDHLLELFPDVGGYRFFLFKARNRRHASWPIDDESVRIFYDMLGDYGFQGESTSDRLRKLFAVQNTYLSTFQSLGGIGILLGLFGLAVIQARNVFERRKELALLQAVGFSQSRIILLLLYENFSLLFRGLGLAVFASFFALLPFLFGLATRQASWAGVAGNGIALIFGMVFVGLISNIVAQYTVQKISIAKELAQER